MMSMSRGGLKVPGRRVTESVMEPTDLTVEQVAAALKSREMTAEAYAESLLARAAAHADLNAFISQDPDAVRAAARGGRQEPCGRRRAADPLAGIPLALKDNIDTTALGDDGRQPGLKDHRPRRNAPVVRGAPERRRDRCSARPTSTSWPMASPTTTARSVAARNPYEPHG